MVTLHMPQVTTSHVFIHIFIKIFIFDIEIILLGDCDIKMIHDRNFQNIDFDTIYSLLKLTMKSMREKMFYQNNLK